jgi:hypothetical protein
VRRAGFPRARSHSPWAVLSAEAPPLRSSLHGAGGWGCGSERARSQRQSTASRTRPRPLGERYRGVWVTQLGERSREAQSTKGALRLMSLGGVWRRTTRSPSAVGSTPERSTTAFRTAVSSTSGAVSLNAPRFALQMGVRTCPHPCASAGCRGRCAFCRPSRHAGLVYRTPLNEAYRWGFSPSGSRDARGFSATMNCQQYVSLWEDFMGRGR